MADNQQAAAIIHERWMRETSKRVTDLMITCAAALKVHNDMLQRGDDGVTDTERMQRTQTVFDAINDIGDRLESLRQLEGLRQLTAELVQEAGNDNVQSSDWRPFNA